MNADHTGREVAPADVDLDRVWTGIAAHVWCRRPGRVERLAGRLLRSPGLARAVLATPSLLWPWMLASVAVLLAAAVLTPGTGTPQVPLVPLLVPAVAAAGMAYAYGPGIDPAFELSRSMAVGDRQVLLARAVAIFAMNAVLGLAASAVAWSVSVAVSAARSGITFGWLAPMVAVAAVALVGATLARSANVGVVAGLAAWCITLLGGLAAGGGPGAAVGGGSLVLPYLLAAALATAVVLFQTRTLKGPSR
jgi:hypothetical protein